MARFFIVVSLLLSFYAGCCSAGLWMSMAHSGSAVEAPFAILVGFDGDKNSDEYTEQLQKMKEMARKNMQQRNASTSNYAYTFAGVSVLQFFVTLGLAFRRRGKMPASPQG